MSSSRLLEANGLIEQPWGRTQAPLGRGLSFGCLFDWGGGEMGVDCLDLYNFFLGESGGWGRGAWLKIEDNTASKMRHRARDDKRTENEVLALAPMSKLDGSSFPLNGEPYHFFPKTRQRGKRGPREIRLGVPPMTRSASIAHSIGWQFMQAWFFIILDNN